MARSINRHNTTKSSKWLFVVFTGFGAAVLSGCGSSDFESREWTGATTGSGGNAGSGEASAGGNGAMGGSGGNGAMAGSGGNGAMAGSGGNGAMAGSGGSGGLAGIGASCGNDAECLSGHCIEGLCCDSACDGACMACAAAKTGASDGTCAPVKQGTDPGNDCDPNPGTTCGNSTGACDGMGACEKHPSGTICGPLGSCVGSSQTTTAICDGQGVCQSGTVSSCLPYICGSSSCLTTCVNDANCAAGYYCLGATCTVKKPDGQVCNAANECQSGSCVTFFGDADADGYGNSAMPIQACSTAPAGYVANNSDCDDSNAAIHPNAAEICGNGVDENCNGVVNDSAVCCVPYNGQVDTTVVQNSVIDTYFYHDYWCIVGTGINPNLPPGCYAGYVIHSQSLAESHCVAAGSGGQCTDSDALWSITCNNVVSCAYQCDGQCLPLSC